MFTHYKDRSIAIAVPIAFVTMENFERLYAAGLHDFADYEAFVDDRESRIIALCAAGVDAYATMISITAFLEFCLDAADPVDLMALDQFAGGIETNKSDQRFQEWRRCLLLPDDETSRQLYLHRLIELCAIRLA
ncbi:MAG: hypothetical protein KGL46_07280 [Hyphomicrobiales bacterium]|nr:hypothetical protein [Hyphomicrobiales bacterium]